jgi:nicotinamide mononucleotide (NMN) deamidase PncC
VVYTRLARDKFLDIPREALSGMRSASEPYALLAARTVQARFSASWGLAETGATGPSGNRYGDAAGHSCMAIAGVAEQAITLETGKGDRLSNMREFAATALKLLHRHLLQQK